MSAIDVEIKYKEWWLLKYCRTMGSRGEFKMVVDLTFRGSPSGTKGSVMLFFQDGTEATVPCGKAFKPRKKDVEVWPHDGPPPSAKAVSDDDH